MACSLLAFGEVLEDYVPVGDGYLKLAGGAPLNMAAEAVKFGLPTKMITELGGDQASQRLLKAMKDEGLDTSLVSLDKDLVLCHTAVTVNPSTGEREFRFYKDKASFLGLCEDDIKDEWVNKGDVVHIGTVCLLGEGIIKAQLKLVSLAQKKGAMVTFDPNLRPSLFKPGEQERLAKAFLPYANVLKLGRDEIEPIVGSDDEKKAASYLFATHPALALVLVTDGGKGLRAYLRNGECVAVGSVKPLKMVDTVGCGDASFGAFIGSLSRQGFNTLDELEEISEKEIHMSLVYAALAGSFVCGQKGALPMPTVPELDSLAKIRGIKLG